MDFDLTREEKIILLRMARKTIRDHLVGTDTATIDSELEGQTEGLKRHCGIFVTLHLRGALRGCIGFITSSKQLIELIRDAAQAAAFQDSRFAPLRRTELTATEIEISVLSPLQKIRSIDEIQVGTHGIVMRHGFYSGLLLPQVATEHGWDRETFLSNTCYKAGLDDDCWKNPSTEIEIFSAVVFNERELGLVE